MDLDRILVLNDGKVEDYDSPANLIHKKSARKTSAFDQFASALIPFHIETIRKNARLHWKIPSKALARDSFEVFQ